MKLKSIIQTVNKTRKCRSGGGLSLMGASLLWLLSLPSCGSESVELPQPESDSSECTLTLNIPQVAFGQSPWTRDATSTSPVEGDEGTLQSLYVVVFKLDEESPTGEFSQIWCGDLVGNYSNYAPDFRIASNQIYGNPKLDDTYKKISDVKLKPGKYKIYVLANVFQYREDSSKSPQDFMAALDTEEAIKNLKLKFDALLNANALPMVCMAKNVCKNESGEEFQDGIIEIKKVETTDDSTDGTGGTDGTDGTGGATEVDNVTHIYAPLSILCSKVRYTLLFDNTPETGFSKAFPQADVNFTFIEDEENPGVFEDVITNPNAVKITSLNLSTLVSPTTSTQALDLDEEEIPDEETEVDPIYYASLSQVRYPNANANDGTAGYFDIANQDQRPPYLSELEELNSWNPPTKRAWQGGAIYLPENLNESKKTTLHFLATGTGVKEEGYKIPLTLKRGTFYDVVAKVTSPAAFEVAVLIKVSPWNYHTGQVQW